MSTAQKNSISTGKKIDFVVLEGAEASKLLPLTGKHATYSKVIGAVIFDKDVRVAKVSLANSEEYRGLSIGKEQAVRALEANRQLINKVQTVAEARSNGNSAVEATFLKQKKEDAEKALTSYSEKYATRPNLLQMWRNREQIEGGYRQPFVQFREFADGMGVFILVKKDGERLVGSTHVEIATSQGYYDAVGRADGTFSFAKAADDGKPGDGSITLPVAKTRAELQGENSTPVADVSRAGTASVGEMVQAKANKRQNRRAA